jgi:hypothetical protein
VVDHEVRPGVQSDIGDGDQWPAIRSKVLEGEILVFASRPGWAGLERGPAVLERMNATLSDGTRTAGP